MASWNVLSTFTLDQVFGYQTAEKLRQNLLVLVSLRRTFHLGGSRTVSLAHTAAALNAVDWVDIEIDGTNLSGLTAQLRVEVRTANAATSITPKLRNVTDATDAGVGASCTATATDYSGTNQVQTIAVTIASGIKKYRLMGTPGNTSNDTFVIGTLELFATA